MNKVPSSQNTSNAPLRCLLVLMLIVVTLQSLFIAPTRATGIESEVAASIGISKFVCSGPNFFCEGTKRFGMSHGNSKADDPSVKTIKPSIQLTFMTFGYDFDVNRLKYEHRRGRQLVVTLSPCTTCKGRDDSVRLADIAAGKFDKYLTRNFQKIKQVKLPVVIRFAHEMNGYWPRWGMPKPADPRSFAYPGNTPKIYVKAFRRVHDVARKVGAKNAMFMWSPDIIQVPGVTLGSLYPGSKYVDIVGLSGYFTRKDDAFHSRFTPALKAIAKFAGQKPIVVIESGVSRIPERPALIRDLVSNLGRYPQIRGWYWLITTTEKDYTLSGDEESITALNESLSNSPYQIPGNNLHAVAFAPIISGQAFIGQTLSASASYSGTAIGASLDWLECPVVESLEGCSLIGNGPKLAIQASSLHKYLRARLTVINGGFTDSAYSSPVGPIFSNLTIPAQPSVTYFKDSVRIQLASPQPVGVRNWVLTVNGGNKDYIPISTTDYWMPKLSNTNDYRITISYLDVYDGKYNYSPELKLNFSWLAPPASPSIENVSGGLKIVFPEVQVGQSGWRIQINSHKEQTIPAWQSSYQISAITGSRYVIILKAINDLGESRPTVHEYQN